MMEVLEEAPLWYHKLYVGMLYRTADGLVAEVWACQEQVRKRMLEWGFTENTEEENTYWFIFKEAESG